MGGRGDGIIVSVGVSLGAGAVVMDSEVLALWGVGVVESVAVTIKDEVPADVGLPEITPVPALRVSPPGRLPLEIDHEYGSVPPAAARVVEYASPTVAPGSDVVVTDKGLAAPL